MNLEPPQSVPEPSYPKPPRTKTTPEMKAVKKTNRNWKAIGGLITSILAGGTGIGAYRAANAQEKVARIDERQKANEAVTIKLVERVDAGEKAIEKVKSDVRVLKVQQRLMLRALKVDERLWPEDKDE